MKSNINYSGDGVLPSSQLYIGGYSSWYLASTLSTRIVNYLDLFAKENPVEKTVVDRISKIVNEKIFANDICYNMVRSIYNNNPSKFKTMMMNKDLVQYIMK